jgi:hypothetical protein
VSSVDNFGVNGDTPTHPELLDWLAAEFVESGWNVKHVLGLMFNSRAYRQVSTSTAALNEREARGLRLSSCDSLPLG